MDPELRGGFTDHLQPELLQFRGVAVLSGREVDLKISTGLGYVAGLHERTGKSSVAGRINFNSSMQVPFLFSFVDSETQEPVTLKKAFITLFDVIDGTGNGNDLEVTVDGVKEYFVTPTTRVLVSKIDFGYRFGKLSAPGELSEDALSLNESVLEPIFAFWHPVHQEHTFHSGPPWDGEERQDVQFYAFKEPVQGSVPVYDFWSAEHSEHTFHTGEPWAGEVKGNLQFYAKSSPSHGLAPIYDFWHPVYTEHTFHAGSPWNGETRGGTQYYAFAQWPDRRELAYATSSVEALRHASLDNSVMLAFEDFSEIIFYVRAATGAKGRDFEFAGWSELAGDAGRAACWQQEA